MYDAKGTDDRRRSLRVHVEGMALLWCGDRISGRYRLSDLSVDGCQLRDGPECSLGTEYELVLDVEPAITTRLPARLVRQRSTTSGRYVLGLQFTRPSLLSEDGIHALVARSLERDHPPGDGRVLIVDADATRRGAIASSLRLLGCSVIETGTTIDAVWELENGPMDVHTAFVARVLGRGDGRDLVRFIGERYAGVRRVLLTEDGYRSEGHDAEAVLSGPFELPRLRKVVPSALLAAAMTPRVRGRVA
jgi:CheY-like chemotaxis protein